MSFLRRLYFGRNIVFFGTALGRFSQWGFFIFRSRPNMVADAI